MNYYTLIDKLNNLRNIHKEISYYGNRIVEGDDKSYIIGNSKSFNSIEECKKYIDERYISERLEKQALIKSLQSISEKELISIFNRNDVFEISSNLVNEKFELAASKEFTIDPIVNDLRKINSNVILEGKIQYILNDSSNVFIDYSTLSSLQELLKDKENIIQQMKESKENFIYVVKRLGEI